MEQQNITLVVTCNDHFAIMLGALMKSIDKNCGSGQTIDLYIVDDNISKKNKLRIAECAIRTNIKIKWLSLDSIFKNIKLPVDNSSFPRNVYTRLYIPLFLPKEIKKAIYLDVDMICCTDISKLWEIELNSHPIAAVKDRSDVVSNEWGGITNYKELGIDADTPYFNAGLIVFNLDIWRAEELTEKIVTVIEKNTKFANFPDQYGLNVVLSSRCLSLDFRWNCFPMYSEPNPYIIHFIGIKPIYQNYADNPKYAASFFDYLKLTPWNNFSPYSGYRHYWNKIIIKIKNKFAALK